MATMHSTICALDQGLEPKTIARGKTIQRIVHKTRTIGQEDKRETTWTQSITTRVPVKLYRMDGWMDGCMDIYIWCQMATDHAGTTISSAPNMQQRCMPSRCHQIPRMPRETKMNVSKCHACHAKSRGDHSGTWEPSAPPELAQCHTCHACHAK